MIISIFNLAKKPTGNRYLSCSIILSLLTITTFASDLKSSSLTLRDAVRTSLANSLERKSDQKNVLANKALIQQASVWQNPTFEIRMDGKIGKDLLTGGRDFSEFVLSQPIPIGGRIKRRKSLAQTNLQLAYTKLDFKTLFLEYQTSVSFHNLQFAQRKMKLATQRLKIANNLKKSGYKRALVGDISKLEKSRLDLIRESAKQNLDVAEGKYNEALNNLSVFMGKKMNSSTKLENLKPYKVTHDLKFLIEGLAQHPSIKQSDVDIEIASKTFDLARAERIESPELRIFRDKDVLGNRVQNDTGIGIAFNLPLWDRKSGKFQELNIRVVQMKLKKKQVLRNLTAQLKQNYLHLSHLKNQGDYFSKNVLKSAKSVFDLTQKAYLSGEVEIISMIDANDAYFDNYINYLEILLNAWLEAAELRFSSGQFLMTTIKD